jgi:signal transduction histidine kinase
MFLRHLYVRIWLAVVLAVAVLTLLVGWAWRLAEPAPLREVVVRNETGQVIGHGRMRPSSRRDATDATAASPAKPGESTEERPENAEEAEHPALRDEHSNNKALAPGAFGSGPEFMVRMDDGRALHIHLPRPPRSPWSRLPFGFFWSLGLVAVAVALATYPIIRKLTRRLEQLQQGVERWGEGDLSVRIPVSGQDEVAFLAERFNHAGERIEGLVKSHEALLASQQALLVSQKSLLANASHELRSPLTRIRMGLELMMPGPSQGRDELTRNIAELDQLIDEILLASRLDAKEADLGTIEQVDLTGLVAEECSRAGAELDAQGGIPSPVVRGVTKLLRRAVRNLLENARRHASGEVKVYIGQEGDLAVVRVCDRGPGVPEHLRERIFEPFYRLPGATERDGGVGLGLALVKSIAIRHGGSAFCEDQPGGGACFVVFLPIAS